MTPSSTRSRPFAAAVSAFLLLAGCATTAPRPTPAAPAKPKAKAAATARAETPEHLTVAQIKAKLDEALQTNDSKKRVALLAEVYPSLPAGSGIQGFVAGILTEGYADTGNIPAMRKVAKDAPLGDDLPTADMLNAMAWAYAESGTHLTEAYVRVDQALAILHFLAKTGGAQMGSRRRHALKVRRGAYLDTEGWVFLKLGETDDAVKVLKQAVALLDESEVHYHLGVALLKQGHLNRGAQELARAVALGGDGAKPAKAALEKLRGKVDVDKLLDEAKKAAAAAQQAMRQAARLHVLEQAVDVPLPAFSATTLDGRPIDTTRLGRGEVAVVWFWATWCEPCREEMPDLETVYRKFKGVPGVRFLGLSVDQDAATARQFVRQVGTDLPMGHAELDAAGTQLNIDGIPTLFVLGPDGRIRYRHFGYDPRLVRDLSLEIEALRGRLAGSPKAVPTTGI